MTMKAEQIALPLRLIAGQSVKEKHANDDLIGRSFFDGSATISVIGVGEANPQQVIVKRDLDGKSWSVAAWLIRMIIGRKRKRHAA